MRTPKYPRKRRGEAPSRVRSPEEQRRDLLDTPVAELAEYGLTLRAVNILETYDVLTVRVLLQRSYEELVQMANLGEKTISELRSALSKIGVEPPAWRVLTPRKSWDGLW